MSKIQQERQRGVWIPADVWAKLESGEMTFSEFKLYHVIDGLVEYEGDGCWATNETLASRVGLHVRQVQNLIAKGIKEGYLVFKGWKKVGDKKRRLLETAWSRIKLVPLNDKEAKEVTRAIDCVVNKRTDEIDCMGTHAIDCVHSNCISICCKREKGTATATRRPSGDSSSGRVTPRSTSSNKSVELPAPKRLTPLTEKKAKTCDERRHVEAAASLRSALRANNRVVRGGSHTEWAHHLCVLEEHHKQDYLPVLEWYKSHCSVEDQKKYGLPSIASAKEFLRQFEWIREKMQKHSTPKRVVPDPKVHGYSPDKYPEHYEALFGCEPPKNHRSWFYRG